MQRRLTFALIGLLAALEAAPVQARTLAPTQARQPGALISAEPVADAPAGMQAWKVRYRTTSQGARPSRSPEWSWRRANGRRRDRAGSLPGPTAPGASP